MFLVGLISWWYGRGWVGQSKRMLLRFKSTLDFFSIGQLLSTLFSPFRQISASPSGGSDFASALRNTFDKLISRIIGSIIRLATIIFGFIVIIFQAVYELLIMIGWWILPLLPIAGFVLVAIGWVPLWK
jgi:hypothetical protein